MEHIKTRLAEYLSKTNLKGVLAGMALQEVLKEELKEEADRVSLHAFRAGVLWVKVPSPAWAAELMSKKTEIIKKINILLGEKLILDLKTLVYSSEGLMKTTKKAENL